MKGFKSNLKSLTIENRLSKKVLYSSNSLQLEIVSLKIGEEIGIQKDAVSDHFFQFEYGIGKCLMEENVIEVDAGFTVLIPKGCKYNIINVSDEHHLNFSAISSPPSTLKAVEQTSKNETPFML
jgi:mannose-6-phosphate isomerase-like protein (cupin superfamily)